MKKMLLPALAGLLLLAAAPVAGATSPDNTCPDAGGFGIAQANTPRDLYVDAGATCWIAEYSTVGRDVIVPRGSTLEVFNDTSIGRDIRASYPNVIEVGNLAIAGGISERATVGRDISVNGASGGVQICRSTVGRDIAVTNGGGNSIPVVGDSDSFACGDFGGNAVGRDVVVTHNSGGADVSDNGPSQGGSIARDLVDLGQPYSSVESNWVGRDALCDASQNHDGDGGPNTVARKDVNCG